MDPADLPKEVEQALCSGRPPEEMAWALIQAYREALRRERKECETMLDKLVEWEEE